MKSIEFMYWLQGSFELCHIEALNIEQTQKIKNHLKMVEITDKNEVLPFCSWLNGFLDSVGDKPLDAQQTSKIKNKLNNIFEHVVEVPQNRMRQELPTGVVIKC